VRAARRAGASPFALSLPVHHFALLAAVDVEANFLIVKAYQFTNITSVTLLDSARRVRPRRAQSVACVVIGSPRSRVQAPLSRAVSRPRCCCRA
jgi:hypothetical protein